MSDTPLVIYNTLTRNKEPFTTVDPDSKRVTIYNCGPTVYDRFHIGNARNFVVMDVVRRYFEWIGFEVVFVQNLTDIDDKIIGRANEEKRPASAVAAEFTEAYFEDAAKLGVREASHHPKATEYVDQMIAFIGELITKGVAYEVGGSIYFRVRAFGAYGKLSGRKIEELREGERIEINPDKEDPLDFVLWKAAKPEEPKWPCPWGEGRPGWHTECACMSRELLGTTIDIHAGGADLQFPHHENEIAQRESLSGRPFARFWMHNGFLNIDQQKMSKSLGNFFKIDEVLDRFPPEAIRAFLLSAHYRHPLDFSDAALEEAHASINRINNGIGTAMKILAIEGRTLRISGNTADVTASDLDRTGEAAAPFIKAFEAAMGDDFNSPRAISVLHDIVSAIHEARQATPVPYDRLEALAVLACALRDFFGFAPAELTGEGESSGDVSVLRIAASVHRLAAEQGLSALSEAFTEELRAEELTALSGEPAAADLAWESFGGPAERGRFIELLIEVRKLARTNKAYAVADSIRDDLSEAGIALEDHPQGTIWKDV